MTPGHIIKAAALAIGVLTLGSAAVAQTTPTTPAADNQTAMIEQLQTFTASGPQGARLPLADVTSFEWDTVHGFAPNMPIEIFRNRLGDDYKMGDVFAESLSDKSAVLVFTNAGEVVSQVAVNPPVYIMGLDAKPHGKGATLTIVSPDPGPYSAVKLVE